MMPPFIRRENAHNYFAPVLIGYHTAQKFISPGQISRSGATH